MLLSREDAALFYRAWWPLLEWVNAERKLVPQLWQPTPQRPYPVQAAITVRNAIWADDALLDQFLATGAGELAEAERALIASWKHRVSRSFIVLKHLKKHSIFIADERVYEVLGLYSPLEDIITPVPKVVETTLLPFGDRIVCDGLVLSPGIALTSGPNIRRELQQTYADARAHGRIIRALPEVGGTPVAAPRRKATTARAHRSSAARDAFHGTWNIVVSEGWDQEALDTCGPAHITFGRDGGVLRMVAIEADLDCEYITDEPMVEFSFAGKDDGQPVSGRGWALQKNDELAGCIYIHRGDASTFGAVRASPGQRRPDGSERLQSSRGRAMQRRAHARPRR